MQKSFFWFANKFVPRFLFRDFFDEKLFHQYVVNSPIEKRLTQSKRNRVFWLKKIIRDIRDIRKNQILLPVYPLLELLLQIEPENPKNKDFMIRELRKLIRENFRARNFPDFESYLKKIEPHDDIYARYFRLYARQNLRADVSLEEWEVLHADSKIKKSTTQRNIVSQIITKQLHLENFDISVAMFKDMIRSYGVALYDLRLVIGVLKLGIKQKRYDDAVAFKEYVVGLDWPADLSYFMSLKLVEVMVELDLEEKKIEIKDGELWKDMFSKMEKMRTLPRNKKYLKDLRAIYDGLEKKYRLLLDIRISNQEQVELFSLIEQKLATSTPFLLLRIGDADCYGLKTDKIDPDQMARDCGAREMKWWGENIPDELREKIRRMFNETVIDTDVMGIPSIFRFISDLAAPENSFILARNQRGSVAVMDAMNSMAQADQFLPSMVFTENRCHHILFNQSALDRLASKAKHIVIMSRHDGEKIKSIFKGHTVDTVQIPDEGLKQESLPFRVDQLVEDLKSKVKKGSLVLVSAGFAGKYFLKVAKDQGAIALDVGAMADYWVGIKSRGVSELV